MSYCSDSVGKGDPRFGWLLYGRVAATSRVWPMLVFQCHEHAQRYAVLAYEEGRRQREEQDTDKKKTLYSEYDPFRLDNADGEETTYFMHTVFIVTVPYNGNVDEALQQGKEASAIEYSTQLLERANAENRGD